MTFAHLLLAALFLLTIGLLVALKLCSLKLDHRTAPLFISGWTLLGAAAVSPYYGHLLVPGWQAMTAHPSYLLLAVLKGVLLYALFVVSQALMKTSLSSRHYVTPLSIGVLTLANAFLGEHLKPHEWFSALGLCALATGFFFKGHLADLDRRARFSYLFLVLLSAYLGTIDQVVTKNANWFTLLLVSNLVLFFFSLAVNARNLTVLKPALTHPGAALAGIVYAATELVKFYQQVSINPVSVVVTVQAMTKPVILLLSALIWKERTVKEQLAWGLLAFLITLPLFLFDG
jgi:hypothetical protein